MCRSIHRNMEIDQQRTNEHGKESGSRRVGASESEEDGIR